MIVAMMRPERRVLYAGSPSPPAGDEPMWTGAGNQHQLLVGDSADAHYANLSAAGAANVGNPRLAPFPSPKINGEAVSAAKNQIIADGDGVAVVNTYLATDNYDTRWQMCDHSSSPDNKTVICQNYRKYDGDASSTFRIKDFHFGASSGASQPQYALVDRGVVSADHVEAGIHTFWQYYAVAGGFTDDNSAYPDGHDQGCQPFGPYWQDLCNDGLYHRFTHLWRASTGVGLYNGRAALWVDGVKIMDVSTATIGVTPDGGFKQWTGVDEVEGTDFVNENVSGGADGSFFGGAKSLNNGATTTQAIRIGDGNMNTLTTLKLWYED